MCNVYHLNVLCLSGHAVLSNTVVVVKYPNIKKSGSAINKQSLYIINILNYNQLLLVVNFYGIVCVYFSEQSKLQKKLNFN